MFAQAYARGEWRDRNGVRPVLGKPIPDDPQVSGVVGRPKREVSRSLVTLFGHQEGVISGAQVISRVNEIRFSPYRNLPPHPEIEVTKSEICVAFPEICFDPSPAKKVFIAYPTFGVQADVG
jgi:hypothetical protein